MPYKSSHLAVMLAAIAIGMFGLAFAAVPLYNIFCKVTGFGGTPAVKKELSEHEGKKIITIRFNADVDPALDWEFYPKQKEIKLYTGESGVALYHAKNNDNRTVKGMAIFNVTPLKIGKYFTKMECFCFSEQVLKPGASADLPVTFYIDPAIEKDPSVEEVTTITLSYTFFEQKDK